MMWSSIANLKENLNKIALDVHDEGEDEDAELSIYNSNHGDDNSISDRRFSHSFAHSRSPTHSLMPNGSNSSYNPEIEQYKAEIKRLQESEAEIKALSVNYAALLKEKEDQLSRLNEENGLLKQNVRATNAAFNASKNMLKGSNDQSPNCQNRSIVRTRTLGSPSSNGSHPKQDGFSNGTRGNEKELADLLEEKNISLATIQAKHEVQVKELQMELDKERRKSKDRELKLQDEQKLKESIHQELNSLKEDKDRSSTEVLKIREELNNKLAEIRRLQLELERQGNGGAGDSGESLKRVIATLQKENTNLKSSETFPGKEHMELSLQKLEKDLMEMRRERDKVVQQLNRLKQHLLEKESEESEKMDEDSKLIEELRQKNEHQRAQIMHLERALEQAIAKQEDVKCSNKEEIQKFKETIDELSRKLASCMSTIEVKNVEILNLQTALGQYYAEIEAKERLGEELAVAKEELVRLAELLKNAHQQAETSQREKEELSSMLSQYERNLAEGRNRVKKLEEDNEKLRRAVEQSMTILNRMSMDSDYYVDRRIVIKLLVTYFQRNHSKEVLDLMVRMLGFSDEDKQRIGLAQQGGGRGVVRGVLGLPGRLVGGILAGGSGESRADTASDNQSFADLWVDFLLKETEERERREAEAEAAANKSKGVQNTGTPEAPKTASRMPHQADTSNYLKSTSPLNQNQLQHEHQDTEFSTVPLTSSESSSRLPRPPLRY